MYRKSKRTYRKQKSRKKFKQKGGIRKKRKTLRKRKNKKEKYSLEKLINLAHKKRNYKDSNLLESESLSKDKIKQQLLSKKFDNNRKYFVMLHVEWCPHCTSALPSFMEAKQKISQERPDVCMEEFECEKHPELKKITEGYPTFLEVVNGKVSNYSGNRSTEDFVNRCKNL